MRQPFTGWGLGLIFRATGDLKNVHVPLYAASLECIGFKPG